MGVEKLIDKVNKEALAFFRKATRDALTPIFNAVKAAAPELKTDYVRRKRDGKIVRLKGTLKDAVRIRRSKNSESAGNAGAFVNVKPLPGNRYKLISKTVVNNKTQSKFAKIRSTQRSADNPRDPFYWWFVENGTKKMAARPYLRDKKSGLANANQELHKSINEFFNQMSTSTLRATLAAYAPLTSLVGTRIVSDRGEQNMARPFIIMDLVGTEYVHTLDHSIEEVLSEEFNITCFADTRLQADAVADQVVNCMKAAFQRVTGRQNDVIMDLDIHTVDISVVLMD